MKAMVLRGKTLAIEDYPVPEPKEGQVLARVLACGICGSDLHAAKFMDDMIEASKASGRTAWDTLSMDRGMVMGHEFVAEVVKAGPGVEGWEPGTRVTCMPILPDQDAPNGFYTVGYSPEVPGAYSEYVLLGARMLLKVDDALPDTIAATTEPCAVGLHAVREARMEPGQTALVMGAGPIGLMTLAWLKHNGARHVSVTDPAEARRGLAKELGADLVLDPLAEDVTARVAEAIDALPVDDEGGNGPVAYGGPSAVTQPDVVFECVGVPGTLQQSMEFANSRGQVVVVGVCMEEDRVRPMVGVNKHLTVRFVLGYNADEYAEALASLTDGSIDVGPMVTRSVSLDELPETFESLSDPRDCKVMVVPG